MGSQWCYNGVTMVLQWCYSGVTHIPGDAHESVGRAGVVTALGSGQLTGEHVCVCMCVCVCVFVRVSV
jgi:hypothetical protein